MLKIEDLFVSYGHIMAVKGVDMEINEGEIVCLIGANGAGKTTIMQSISGLVPVRKGRIFFEGKNIAKEKSPIRESAVLPPCERCAKATMSIMHRCLLTSAERVLSWAKALHVLFWKNMRRQ